MTVKIFIIMMYILQVCVRVCNVCIFSLLYRPLLKQIKNSAESHIVLDCSTERIYDVLKQAQQIGMMSDYHSYLITSLVSLAFHFLASLVRYCHFLWDHHHHYRRTDDVHSTLTIRRAAKLDVKRKCQR